MLAEEGEGRHDDHVCHGHRHGRLDERIEPVSAPDGQDADEAAHKDVGGHFDGAAVHRPAEKGEHCNDDGGGTRVEEDRDQHARGSHGDEVREDRAARRQLEAEGRHDEHQPNEEQRVVAMPERRPEAPDPGQEHRNEDGGEQRPAGQLRRVQRRPVEIEGVDLLEILLGDRVALANDGLACPDRRMNGRHGILGTLPSLIGERLAVRRVGHEQRLDKRNDEVALRAAEGAVRSPPQLRCGVGDVRVAQLRALHFVEQAGGIRSDRLPSLGGQFEERGSRIPSETR